MTESVVTVYVQFENSPITNFCSQREGRGMNEDELALYAREILYLLSCQDPAYPKVNFLLFLIEDIKRALLRSDCACDLSETTVGRHLMATIRGFASHTTRKEVIGSLHIADVSEGIQSYIDVKSDF